MTFVKGALVVRSWQSVLIALEQQETRARTKVPSFLGTSSFPRSIRFGRHGHRWARNSTILCVDLLNMREDLDDSGRM